MLCSQCLWLVGLLETQSLSDYTQGSPHMSMISICLTAPLNTWNKAGTKTLCSWLLFIAFIFKLLYVYGKTWLSSWAKGNPRRWEYRLSTPQQGGKGRSQPQSSCPELRGQWRQIILGMVTGFETSKSTPSDETFSSKVTLSSLIQAAHQWGTESLNIWFYVGCSHLNHLTLLPGLHRLAAIL